MSLVAKIKNIWTEKGKPLWLEHRKKIFIGLTSLLVIWWIAAWLGFFRYPFAKVRAFEAVPRTTAIVLETSDWKSCQTKLEEATYRSNLDGLNLMRKWRNGLSEMDSLLTTNEHYKSFLDNAHILSAACTQGPNDFEWLWLIEDASVDLDLDKWAQSLNPIERKESVFRGTKVYQIVLDSARKHKWAFAKTDGIILIAHSSNIVEEGIGQLSNVSSNWRRKDGFSQVNELTGSGDLSVYICFENIASFLGIAVEYPQPSIDVLKNISTWSGVDVRLADSNFVMSGHWYPKGNFLEQLAQQAPPSQSKVSTYLPDNIAVMTYVGVQNFQSFYQAYQTEQYADFEYYILPWIHDELVYFITEPTSADFSADKFVLIKSKDIRQTEKLLADYGEQFGELYNQDYQNFTIKQLAANDLMKPIFGEVLNPIQNPYYLIIDDMVLFGNSLNTMKLWVEKYNFGKTLGYLPKYQSFIYQLENQSNLYFFIDLPRSAQLVNSYLQPEIRNSITNDYAALQKISPLGIQANAFQGHFLTTISVTHDIQPILKKPKAYVSWRCELKADAATPAYPIYNGNTKSYEVIVQDVENRLYLLDRSGLVLWEKVFEEPILSEIHAVDIYDNDRLMFVFNTKKAIHMLDRDGEEFRTIPLVHPAASPLSVIDYGKGPRLFIACQNGAVYGYDKYGKPLTGWNPLSGVGQIEEPVRYMRHKDKDYLLMLNTSGKLYAYKRNAKAYFSASMGLGVSDYAIDSKIGRITAGNKNGKIGVSNIKGKTFSIAAQANMTSNGEFAYSDIIGDDRKDYIRLSDKTLTLHYYDSTQTLAKHFTYQFDNVQDDVFGVDLPQSDKDYIGTYSNQWQSIYLFDENGELQKGFPLVGTTKFFVIDLFLDNSKSLVVANRNMVYVYKI